MALEAHGALEDGVGVNIVPGSNHFQGKTAAPSAGTTVDYITVTTADAAGDPVDVARVYHGDIVQLRADGDIVPGTEADVMVKTNGRYITATATNTVQYKALTGAEAGSVFSAVRVEPFTKA
jgi:hypothetical protein